MICYLVIDRPNVVKQEESSYATALTKQILTEVCPYLGIPMTEEISEKEKEEEKESFDVEEADKIMEGILENWKSRAA